MRKNSVPLLILFAGMAIAAGIFVFFDFSAKGQNAVTAPPQWSQKTGAGISVPACGSSNANVTCSGGSPSVAFSWQNDGNTEGVSCQTTYIKANGTTIASGLPCTGSYTWTGGSNNTNYSYEIRYKTALQTVCTYYVDYGEGIVLCATWGQETVTYPSGGNEGHLISSGSFTTPSCVPLSASCSVSPTSANTGDTVTWSAQASGGTGSYTYSWSGTDGLSGSTQSVQKSYSSGGTKTGSVSVTSGLSSTQFTQSTTPAWSNRQVFSSAGFNNKIWVYGGVVTGQVPLGDLWYSSDGANWTQVASHPLGARRGAAMIAYNNKLWVLGGYNAGWRRDVWSSTDGFTWSQITASAAWPAGQIWQAATAYSGYMWIAVNGAIWRSSDGASWTQIASGLPSNEDGNSLGALASKLVYYTGANGSVYSSPDGIAWTNENQTGLPSRGRPGDMVAWNGNVWLSSGDNYSGGTNDLYSSSDGRTWARECSNCGFPARRGMHEQALFNDHLWVMAGFADNWVGLRDVWSIGSQQVTQSCSNSVNVSQPTLSAALSANPSSGNAPLNGVDLTATVSGTAQGPINYTFYCNRSDFGTNITSGWAAKFDNTSDNPKTAVDACNYSGVGTYTAKVIVERDSLASESRQTVTVSTNPPCVGQCGCVNNCPPCPAGGGISCPPGSNQNPGSAAFGENPAGACNAPLRPTFNWTYSDPDGDPQSAYEIEVDNNSGFSSPEIDTGKTSGTVTSYQASSGALAYNTTYYWRVRVWDSKDAVSNWANGPTFSTQPHQAPTTNYAWSPTEPNINQNTKFTDQSATFGGSSKQSWNWAFTDGNPSSASDQNPNTKFQSSGDKSTSLILKDSSNLSCGIQKTVTVKGASAPSWQEVPPE